MDPPSSRWLALRLWFLGWCLVVLPWSGHGRIVFHVTLVAQQRDAGNDAQRLVVECLKWPRRTSRSGITPSSSDPTRSRLTKQGLAPGYQESARGPVYLGTADGGKLAKLVSSERGPLGVALSDYSPPPASHVDCHSTRAKLTSPNGDKVPAGSA